MKRVICVIILIFSFVVSCKKESQPAVERPIVIKITGKNVGVVLGGVVNVRSAAKTSA